MGRVLNGSDFGEIFWLDHDDVANGNGGDDNFMAARSYINGATIYAGAGNDQINSSNWENMVAYGGEGNDLLAGGYNNSFLDGGDGNDNFTLEKGIYKVIGGVGNDIITVNLPKIVPVIRIPEWDMAYSAKLENSLIQGDSGFDTIDILADSAATLKFDRGNGFVDIDLPPINRTSHISKKSITLENDGHENKQI